MSFFENFSIIFQDLEDKIHSLTTKDYYEDLDITNLNTTNAGINKLYTSTATISTATISTATISTATISTATISNIFLNTGDATLKLYSGKTTDGKNDGSICF